MKRFFPVLASLMMTIGCASQPIQLPKAPPPDAPVPEPQPTLVAHDEWSITLPPRWKFNDVPQQDDESTKVLFAQSTYNEGRGPITLGINTSKFEGPDPMFGVASAMVVQKAAEAEGQKVLTQKMVMVDGRPGSLSILLTKHAVVVGIIAVGIHNVGYVLSCGGDASEGHGRTVARTCAQTMASFRVK